MTGLNEPNRPEQARIIAVMTSFNRKPTTLACLDALAVAAARAEIDLQAVLVDDASTDGTAQAVRAEFPWVDVTTSDGSLFWCRGMHLAFDIALQRGFDHYLWLNDDTVLRPNALAGLLACEAHLRRGTDSPLIVVGSTVDPATGACTYGGERRSSRLRSLRVECIEPTSAPQRCDSLTGNIVLIPARAAQRVGNLDPRFEHAMGDTDYALRARRLGVELWIAPRVHGSCAHNPPAGTYKDASLPALTRWKRMLDRKGLPWRSWLTFTRRHMGVMWPLYFVWPYAKLWVESGLAASRRRALPP